MRKILSSLCLTAVMLVSLVAKADNTVSASIAPTFSEYVVKSEAFDAAQVAEQLGLADTAALKALVTAGGAVQLRLEDGTYSATYTGNTNEFWMNASATPQGYSADGTCWFVGMSYSEPEGETPASFDVYVGQMPGYFTSIYTESNLTATIAIVNGDKKVEYTCSLHVDAAVQASEIAKTFSELQFVKEYNATVELTEGKQYEGKTLEVDMTDIYEALGIDQATLDATLSKVVCAIRANTDKDGVTTLNDTLEVVNETDGWFGRYTTYDEATGSKSSFGNGQSYLKNWSGGCTVYLQNSALAEGKFTLSYGQYPNTMSAGNTDFAELYIVNGTKAAKLTVKIEVKAPDAIPFEEMTKAGEQNIEISVAIDDNYATKAFTVDMATLTEALGCTADDIDDIYSWAAEGNLSNNHTEVSGGFYFGEDGFISNWGSSSAFFVAKTSIADGTYTIGQMSGHYTAIQNDSTCTAQLIFMYGAKYYAVNIKYTVKAPAQGGEEIVYTLKSNKSISIKIVPGEEWAWGTTTALDLDYIESVIGTQDFKLYTDKAVKNEGEDTKLEWSDKYTCTPAPGFWYGVDTYENEEHQVVVDNAGWGSNSFGLTYASGNITWYQYPGQRTAGDAYLAYIYLVNTETGAYMRYAINVKYVTEVTPEAETTKTVEGIAYADPEEGVYASPLNMDDLKAVFEVEDVEILKEAATFLVAKSQSMFAQANYDRQYFFNANGYSVSETDESAVFMAGFRTNEDNENIIEIYGEVLDGATISEDFVTYLAIEYNSKRIVFRISYTTDINKYTAIETVAAGTDCVKAIYSVTGAKLSATQKGINIIKMADGTSKKIMK